MGDHEPLVSSEQAERIRRWHEAAYAEVQRESQAARTFEYFGRTLLVPPGVQPIMGTSHLLGQAVLDEVDPKDAVLDMGTGSGVNAILAASRSPHVVAVDVNPAAVAAARDNVVRNGVIDRVVVRVSDVFSEVSEAFDLVIFDPPFRWFRSRDALEAATTDHGYRALRTFFAQVGEHLMAAGRILIFFGTTGDAPFLHEQIADAGLHSTVVAQEMLTKDGWTAEYLTLRLTR
jgi:release factor glutamine methyltransferase